jgi:hypothetical protein
VVGNGVGSIVGCVVGLDEVGDTEGDGVGIVEKHSPHAFLQLYTTYSEMS